MFFSLPFITLSLSLLSHYVSPAPISARQAGGDSSPRFVIYTDKFISNGVSGLPNPDDLKGYTHLMLGFLLPDGAADQSQAWASLPQDQRDDLKGKYAANGLKVMVSAFGGTSQPTTEGKDPADTAQTMAQFVKANNLDGIDIDYEDLTAVSAGTALAWLTTFMQTLRQELPSGQFLVSHAPLAPHFSPQFPTAPTPEDQRGPYLQLDKALGKDIDFYNVQFYNDGDTVYTDCTGLLTNSGTGFPQSSIFEIAANGVALNKLVIGKPVNHEDASNGFMTPELMGQCASQAAGQGWNAGIMGFQFSDANSAAAFIGPSQQSLGGPNAPASFLSTSTPKKSTSPGGELSIASDGTPTESDAVPSATKSISRGDLNDNTISLGDPITVPTGSALPKATTVGVFKSKGDRKNRRPQKSPKKRL